MGNEVLRGTPGGDRTLKQAPEGRQTVAPPGNVVTDISFAPKEHPVLARPGRAGIASPIVPSSEGAIEASDAPSELVLPLATYPALPGRANTGRSFGAKTTSANGVRPVSKAPTSAGTSQSQ